MIYAGIGARKTPAHIMDIMRASAVVLAKEGYTCNTGAARGADQTFAQGAVAGGGVVDLKLPWNKYEEVWISNLRLSPTGTIITTVLDISDVEAFDSVDQLHPAPLKLRHTVIKLHARNYLIIVDAKFIVCWTPLGKTVGGTGQGIRIAEMLGIPVYNLGNDIILNNFRQYLGI